MSLSTSQHSPGPANVALARGINVETGKRNNDNAMIAAAALAAAADIPLPLQKKVKLQPTRKVQPIQPAPPTQPVQAPVQIPVPAPVPAQVQTPVQNATLSQTGQVGPVKSPISPDQKPAQAVKAENVDDLMTEPEEDENRTEEEPVLESQAPTPAMPSMPTLPSLPEPVEEEKPFRPPPLHLYKVDPDSGIIGCICGIEEDDGFTIQCDVCFRWQHCSCMGYKTNDEVPEDEYKCYFCDTGKWNRFDPDKCRSDTVARLELDKVSNEPQTGKPTSKRKTLGSAPDGKRRKTEKETKPAPGGDRPANDRRKSSNSAIAVSSPSANMGILEVRNKENDLLEEGVSAESYQSVYYKLKANDYKSAEVKKLLEILGDGFERSPESLAIEIMPLALYKSTKFSKVILPVHQKYLQDRNELNRSKGHNKTSVQVKAYSENPKQKFVGISKSGLFISERAVTPAPEYTIPAGTEVIEYLGEIDFFELYIGNPVNQYSLWGTVKPRVARVDLKLSEDAAPVSVVLDSRFVGNEARFIRKACPSTANCEIKPVYIPQLRAFKFLVTTSKPIVLKGETLDEELRLSWEWDDLHPIKKMFTKNGQGETEEGMKFEDFADEEKVLLVSGIDNILNFVECGCNTTTATQQCAIFKVKKATSYLLRSTRKASSLSNVAFNKSKEELVMPKKAREFVSWKERLLERDDKLHSAIFSVNTPDDSSESEIEGQEEVSIVSGEVIQKKAKANEDDRSGFFRLPFKKQLLAQGRKYATKRETTIEVSKPEEVSFSFNSVPKTLGVPIVSNILASIKDSVNESLKPLAKIASNVQIALDTHDVNPIGTEIELPSASWEEASPALAAIKIDEIPILETKPKAPPAVKKLSFADYKKKMK